MNTFPNYQYYAPFLDSLIESMPDFIEDMKKNVNANIEYATPFMLSEIGMIFVHPKFQRNRESHRGLVYAVERTKDAAIQDWKGGGVIYTKALRDGAIKIWSEHGSGDFGSCSVDANYFVYDTIAVRLGIESAEGNRMKEWRELTLAHIILSNMLKLFFNVENNCYICIEDSMKPKFYGDLGRYMDIFGKLDRFDNVKNQIETNQMTKSEFRKLLHEIKDKKHEKN